MPEISDQIAVAWDELVHFTETVALPEGLEGAVLGPVGSIGSSVVPLLKRTAGSDSHLTRKVAACLAGRIADPPHHLLQELYSAEVDRYRSGSADEKLNAQSVVEDIGNSATRWLLANPEGPSRDAALEVLQAIFDDSLNGIPWNSNRPVLATLVRELPEQAESLIDRVPSGAMHQPFLQKLKSRDQAALDDQVKWIREADQAGARVGLPNFALKRMWAVVAELASSRDPVDVLGLGPRVEGKPWRWDPRLVGRFHPEAPDDLQVIIHEGGPRITKSQPELVWVTVQGVQGDAFLGAVLNAPASVASVQKGSTILFVAPEGGEHLLMVSEKYLSERGGWLIHPCNQCGLSEIFDAPSDLVKATFPQMPKDSGVEMFTTFCGACGGQMGLEAKR